MRKLENKIAVITGGARDIGKAISLKFAEEGANICINYYHSRKEAEETKNIIEQNGGQAMIVKADLTDSEQASEFVKNCADAFGENIDILVNNSGGLLARKKLEEMDLNFWERVISLNLTTTFIMTKLAVPYMRSGSSIINLSSQAARDGGGEGASAYSAAKGGILTFTKSMAKELGPRGIRVNAISAGMINTRFHDNFTKPEIRKKVAESSPLRREGKSTEIADLACFLASNESSYITGASVEINGGLYMI